MTTTINTQQHERLWEAFRSAVDCIDRFDSLDWESVASLEYAKGGCLALIEAITAGAVLSDELVEAWANLADCTEFMDDEEDSYA
jgi:hypothetical protein